MLKLSSVTLLALLSLSPPQSQSDEIAALKREIQALKAQQTAMERDLQAIKTFLQGLAQRGQPSGPVEDEFVNKFIPISDEPRRATPARRSRSSRCRITTARSAGGRPCRPCRR